MTNHFQPAREIQLGDLADAYVSGVRDGRAYPTADAFRSADGWVKLFIAETHDPESSLAPVSPVPEPSEPPKWEWCDHCSNWWWSAHGHICGCVFVNSDIPGCGILIEPPSEPMPSKPPGDTPK